MNKKVSKTHETKSAANKQKNCPSFQGGGNLTKSST